MIFVDKKGHLVTDEPIGALHEFAEGIGLKREWFQDKRDRPHYDLTTARMIALAMKKGAVRVRSKVIVLILRGERLVTCQACGEYDSIHDMVPVDDTDICQVCYLKHQEAKAQNSLTGITGWIRYDGGSLRDTCGR